METDNDLPTRKRRAEAWKLRQKEREVASSNCYDASEAGDIDQIRDIIRGGQLEQEDLDTILYWAVGEGLLEPTRCLLEGGADVKSMPLPRADSCQSSLEMFKLLAEFRINYNSEQINILAHATGHREILDWLLDQGLDINRGAGHTIHGADERGHVTKVYRDRTCEVLNVAAHHGDIDLFDHLVARGADPSRSNALHYAASCKDAVKAAAMITHLIETYHLDPNASDSCGGLNDLVNMPGGLGAPCWDPLNHAVSNGNFLAAEALLKFGADPSNSIYEAIEQEQGPAVKFLLEAGADCSKGLHRAVTHDFLEGAELCLQYGADPADAERHDKELADDPEGLSKGMPPWLRYKGMTPEMRKLLGEWKAKRNVEVADTELKTRMAKL